MDLDGLRYPLEFIDKFSSTKSKFISSIDEMKAKVEELRNTMAATRNVAQSGIAIPRDQLAAVNRHTQALKRSSRASSAEAAAESARNRINARAQRRAKARIDQERENTALANAQYKERLKRARALRASRNNQEKVRLAAENAELKKNTELQKQSAKALKDVEAARARILQAARNRINARAQRRADARSAAEQADQDLGKQQLKERQERAKKLRAERRIDDRARLAAANAVLRRNTQFLRQNARAAREAERAHSQFAFRVRRVVEAVGVLTVIRQVTRGFRDYIGAAIGYQKVNEDAALGIASLYTGLGRLVDAQGTAIQGAEALAAAQRLARKELAILRKENLRTVATLEELVFAYQTATAPGLAQGFDIESIRKLSVGISQVAAAIGQPQDQLAEEIRALFQGTIRVQTSRIATVLGITPADIKRVQEAGTQVEFLQEKLESFAIAGEASMRNLSVTIINLGDIIRQAIGESSAGFALTLKKRLKELSEFIAPTEGKSLSDTIEINPGVVSALNKIDDALSRVIDRFAELARDFGLEGLKRSASGASVIIELLGAVVSSAVKFLLNFTAAAGYAIEGIAGMASALSPLVFLIGEVTQLVGPYVLALVLLNKVLQAVSARLAKTVLAFAAFTKLRNALGASTFLRALGLVRVIPVIGAAAAIASVFYNLLAGKGVSATEKLTDAHRKYAQAIEEGNREAEAAALREQIKLQEELASKLKADIFNKQAKSPLLSRGAQQNAFDKNSLDGLRKRLNAATTELDKLRIKLKQVQEESDAFGVQVVPIDKALSQSLNLASDYEQRLTLSSRRVELAFDRLGQPSLGDAKQEFDIIRQAAIEAEKAVDSLLKTRDRMAADIRRTEATIADPAKSASDRDKAAAKLPEQVRQYQELVDNINKTRDAAQKDAEERIATYRASVAGLREFELAQERLAIKTEALRDEANLPSTSPIDRLRLEALADQFDLQKQINEKQRERSQLDGVQQTIVDEQIAALQRQLDIRTRTADETERQLRAQDALTLRAAASSQNAERFRTRAALDTTLPAAGRTLELRAQEQDILAQTAEIERQRATAFGVERTVLEGDLALLREKLAITREQLALDERRNANPGREGITAGLEDFQREYSDTFTLIREYTASAVTQLGQAFGNVFLAAFGPNAREQIKQEFGRLLATLAQQLAQSAFLQLISQVFGSLGINKSSGASGAGSHHLVPGFHKGGYVGHSAPRAAPLPGLHSSDVVPARLGIGEHVMDKDSVRAWGSGFLAWLQRNRPENGGLLGALLKNAKVKSRPQHKYGYASGGLVGTVQNSKGNGSNITLNVTTSVAPSEEAAYNLLRSGSGKLFNRTYQRVNSRYGEGGSI